MNKFNRTYRLQIGKNGGKGIEIMPPFQIEFEVEKDSDSDPNVHRIKLFNLAPETAEAVSKPDGFCVLYAGYGEEEGGILLASGVAYGLRHRGADSALAAA